MVLGKKGGYFQLEMGPKFQPLEKGRKSPPEGESSISSGSALFAIVPIFKGLRKEHFTPRFKI